MLPEDMVNIALVCINRTKYRNLCCMLKPKVVEYMIMECRKRGCMRLPFMFEKELFTSLDLRYRMFPELISAIKVFDSDIFNVNDTEVNLSIMVVQCYYRDLPFVNIIQQMHTNINQDNINSDILTYSNTVIGFDFTMNELKSLPPIGKDYLAAMARFNK